MESKLTIHAVDHNTYGVRLISRTEEKAKHINGRKKGGLKCVGTTSSSSWSKRVELEVI